MRDDGAETAFSASSVGFWRPGSVRPRPALDADESAPQGVSAAGSTPACGRVPGLDGERFADLAREGEAGCPVSNALRGNVEITVAATLDG